MVCDSRFRIGRIRGRRGGGARLIVGDEDLPLVRLELVEGKEGRRR